MAVRDSCWRKVMGSGRRGRIDRGSS
jgi:hypothetical protein